MARLNFVGKGLQQHNAGSFAGAAENPIVAPDTRRVQRSSMDGEVLLSSPPWS